MESKMESKLEWLPIAKACASIFIVFLIYMIAKYNLINVIMMLFAGKITLSQIKDLILIYMKESIFGSLEIKKERTVAEKEDSKRERLTPSVDI
jgi:hypothetical protein